MSNVLIGIIGVILFIGLALAGALFLGPRFQESTNNSRASAAVQAVSQVASAANMYRVQEGTPAGAITDLTGEGYLKSVPSNPAGTADPVISGNFVTMVLTENGESVCEAINKQSGVPDAGPVDEGYQSPSAMETTQGCTDDGAGVYTAFASI